METFAALGDPTRRHIIEMLRHGELSAGDISRRFEMSAPAISQHLRTLKDARLVSVRVDAQRRIYALDPVGIAEVADWVDSVRNFWNPRLDALEAELKTMAEKDKT